MHRHHARYRGFPLQVLLFLTFAKIGSLCANGEQQLDNYQFPVCLIGRVPFQFDYSIIVELLKDYDIYEVLDLSRPKKLC